MYTGLNLPLFPPNLYGILFLDHKNQCINHLQNMHQFLKINHKNPMWLLKSLVDILTAWALSFSNAGASIVSKETIFTEAAFDTSRRTLSWFWIPTSFWTKRSTVFIFFVGTRTYCSSFRA